MLGARQGRGPAARAEHPGVNSNFLAGDGPATIEPLSGMSHLSGILVELRKAPPGSLPGEDSRRGREDGAA